MEFGKKWFLMINLLSPLQFIKRNENFPRTKEEIMGVESSGPENRPKEERGEHHREIIGSDYE